MRVRALALSIVQGSAVLLFGCDAPQPFDPSGTGELTVAAARNVSELGGPTGANAVPASESRMDISWVDNSSNETGFEVHRSTSGESGTFVLLTTTAAKTIHFADQGLSLSAPYCYKVRAVRVAAKATTYSTFSNTACSSTPPNAPSNLAALAAPETSINLSWQDNSNTETSFQILRAVGETGTEALLTTMSPNSVAFADQWGIAGTRYCYRVRAVRRHSVSEESATFTYSELSNAACATAPPKAPPTAPLAASNTNATPSSSFSVTITWTDNSSNEDEFRIYRSTDNGVLWTLAGTGRSSVFGQAMSLEDSGRQPEQQVCYRVIAVNTGGEAPPSNVDCTTPPAAPSDLTATPVNAETVRLQWVDNSAVEDGYEVWLRWSHGDCSASAGWYDGETLIAELPVGSTEYSFTPESMGCGPFYPAGYFGYFVVAARDGGRSSPSNEVVLP